MNTENFARSAHEMAERTLNELGRLLADAAGASDPPQELTLKDLTAAAALLERLLKIAQLAQKLLPEGAHEENSRLDSEFLRDIFPESDCEEE